MLIKKDPDVESSPRPLLLISSVWPTSCCCSDELLMTTGQRPLRKSFCSSEERWRLPSAYSDIMNSKLRKLGQQGDLDSTGAALGPTRRDTREPHSARKVSCKMRRGIAKQSMSYSSRQSRAWPSFVGQEGASQAQNRSRCHRRGHRVKDH